VNKEQISGASMVMDGWIATTPHVNKHHNIVAYLLKARAAESEKQLLLGNAHMKQ
jgi:hypothetical protein